jgi:hypothetical protein
MFALTVVLVLPTVSAVVNKKKKPPMKSQKVNSPKSRSNFNNYANRK